MAKPSLKPRWADVVSGDPTKVLAPPGVKQDVGFSTAERPPAQFLNWLLWVIYLWVNYLDGLANEAFTWAAAHTFQSAVTFQGSVTASDYRFTGTRDRMIPASTGTEAGTTSTQDWSGDAFGAVTNTTPGSSEWTLPIIVESGETVTVAVQLSQATAVVGGVLSLHQKILGASSGTLIGTQPIAFTTSEQTITLATNFPVVTGAFYAVDIFFASGAGLRTITGARVTYKRA